MRNPTESKARADLPGALTALSIRSRPGAPCPGARNHCAAAGHGTANRAPGPMNRAGGHPQPGFYGALPGGPDRLPTCSSACCTSLAYSSR
jgi:hypothetical protein